MDREVRRLQLGVVHIDMLDVTPPANVHGGYHHMGTTRMHEDPTLGVVDALGRVHGIRNLYVSGSSLFPTVGFANPTLTIGALAIRLADELKTLLPERVVLASELLTAHAAP
jgi:choline dehydrogenase-like flavoprotein